jgi:hypothetical protein
MLLVKESLPSKLVALRLETMNEDGENEKSKRETTPCDESDEANLQQGRD